MRTGSLIGNDDAVIKPVEHEPGLIGQYLPSWLGDWLPSRLGGDSQKSASKGLTDAFERAGSEKVNLRNPDKEHGYKPALEQRYGLLKPRDGNPERYTGIRA